MSVDIHDSRRPRSPGVVFTSLSVALLVLLGIVALSAYSPPPPTIAEYAPQALEVINEPSHDTSDSGTGGREADGQDLVVDPLTGKLIPRPSPPAIEVSRVRRCVGDPPRQIEDPQSPPCVPYWSGDNGGATAKGVTRDEIIVARNRYPAADATATRLAAFFNNRFEFYGRRIRLVDGTYSSPDTSGGQQDRHQRAAVYVDEEKQVFASLNYPDQGGGETAFYDELARRRVVSISGFPQMEGESHRAPRHPYQWAKVDAQEDIMIQEADWICSQVAGYQASHAGGPEALRKRTFGLLVHTYNNDWGEPDTSRMEAMLAGCGAKPAAVVRHLNSLTDPQLAQTAMLTLRTADVTTIICLCQSTALVTDMVAASDNAWYPEWLVTSAFAFDLETLPKALGPRDQLAHTFGLSFYNKWLPVTETPIYWAVKEVDPSYRWSNNDVQETLAIQQDTWIGYGEMLMLASGIQLAGPHLTPETFAAGLRKARFPNPGCGGPPYWQACVKFDGHTFHRDAAVWWWSNDAVSVWGGTGAWCYADRGERHALGTWPRRPARVFQLGTCY